MDRAVPHCPAPVSVASRRIPSQLVVVNLRDGGVQLVAAGGIGPLVFVIDTGRGSQAFLQSIGSVQHAGTHSLIFFPNLFRNLNIAFGGHLLFDYAFRENSGQIISRGRLFGNGTDVGIRLLRHIRQNIVPKLRDRLLRQGNLIRDLIFFHLRHAPFPGSVTLFMIESHGLQQTSVLEGYHTKTKTPGPWLIIPRTGVKNLRCHLDWRK